MQEPSEVQVARHAEGQHPQQEEGQYPIHFPPNEDKHPAGEQGSVLATLAQAPRCGTHTGGTDTFTKPQGSETTEL